MKDIINSRRAYRALEEIEIGDNVIRELATAAQLAPSCYNNQPWRFVFVVDKEMKDKVHEGISKGNEWVFNSSMIIAVFSKADNDCTIKNREYYLFDTGIAAGFMMLRATEMGLVAHPIAGYDERMVKGILNIPEEMVLITLIALGKHSQRLVDVMSEKEKKQELERPERLPFEKFSYINKYKNQ